MRSATSAIGYEFNLELNLMEKKLIQQAKQSISPPSENALCAKSHLPATAKTTHLLGSTKENFFTKYNPSTTASLLAKGYTPGRVALLPDIPSLYDVAAHWGKDIAVSWIEILLTNIEEKLGSSASFLPEAKKDTASLLYSYYRDMNLAEFLLFLGYYKLNKYRDLYTSGLDRITCAFALYREQRDAELDRLEREAEHRLREQEWEERAKRCITYEEYQQSKNLEQYDKNN